MRFVNPASRAEMDDLRLHDERALRRLPPKSYDATTCAFACADRCAGCGKPLAGVQCCSRIYWSQHAPLPIDSWHPHIECNGWHLYGWALPPIRHANGVIRRPLLKWWPPRC